MRCGLCKGRSQKSRALSRPGSAWLAGMRWQRWMNWVRPSAGQARPRFFQALAQLSFPLSDTHLPRSRPSQQSWLLCGLEGCQNPHSPAAWLYDLS